MQGKILDLLPFRVEFEIAVLEEAGEPESVTGHVECFRFGIRRLYVSVEIERRIDILEVKPHGTIEQFNLVKAVADREVRQMDDFACEGFGNAKAGTLGHAVDFMIRSDGGDVVHGFHKGS